MTEPSAPTLDPEQDEQEPREACPRCGAPYASLQEYCLECGERLPVNRGVVGVLATGWQRRLAWYPGDWIWPAGALLLLAVAATAIAVAFGSRDSSGGSSVVVATGSSVALGPGRLTGTVATVTTTTGPLPTAPEPTVPERTPPAKRKPPANPNALTTWPSGKSGYTVVLESIPLASGRAFALQRARRAKAAGLTQVGVLNSSNYSSFHPGFYVVFAGIYGSYADASAALGSAHGHGFGTAYPRQVTR
jgi:hypothetical protein